MRRFSQRNSLVTLSDINITPLLDLAFVLLIIFVITTPLLEKGLDLQLPSITNPKDKPEQNKNRHVVEVDPQGHYEMDHQRMSLEEISRRLAEARRLNPNVAVDIRADKSARFELFSDIMDRCEQLGITDISVRGNPRTRKP